MVDVSERAAGDGLPAGYRMTDLGPLPDAWRLRRLGELGSQFFSGGTPSSKVPEYWDGGVPWTTSAAVSGLKLTRGVREISPLGLSRSAAKVVPAGNLLIGTRVGVGKVAINEIDMAISQDLTGMVVDHDQVDVLFLAYALQSPPIQGLFRTGARGSTIKGIPREDLLQITVPLPPLPEQRAIAHVLSTVQRAREATEAVIAATRELKRSLMQHLFTYGPIPPAKMYEAELHETELGGLKQGWTVVRLGEVAELLQYGTSERCDYDPTGIPVLRIPNVFAGRIDTGELKFAHLRGAVIDKLRLLPGDILFVRTNGSQEEVGRAAVYRGRPDPAIFASYLIRVRVDNSRVIPDYVEAYMASPVAGGQVRGRASKAADGKYNVNTQTLRGLTLPLPSLTEQIGITAAVDSLDQKLLTEERRQVTLEVLFASLLCELMAGRVGAPVDSG